MQRYLWYTTGTTVREHENQLVTTISPLSRFCSFFLLSFTSQHPTHYIHADSGHFVSVVFPGVPKYPLANTLPKDIETFMYYNQLIPQH